MTLGHNIDDGQRTQDVKISLDLTFDSMLLSTNTLEGLKNAGFYKPSPIQLHAIPMGKVGFDLLLEAKSGTGKTAVFSVIALETLDLEKGVQVLILAPTREIAVQISDVIKQIGTSYKGLQVEVVVGGLALQEDICKFQKIVHIVVGSPGRLHHLIRDNYIDISAVKLIVLDEADKLVDKSFQTDINYIFSNTPKQKQVIMSSATFSEYSKTLINQYVVNAQHICPDTSSILLGISQKFTTIKYHSSNVKQTQLRFQELIKILSNKPFKQCLIFCNYQATVTKVYKLLTREKWPAEQLHGKQEQTDRLDALKTLQEYKCRILITTDLAARGIDASNVDLVINFEPPHKWQTYLHRIGRAGRFGSYGMAVTILTGDKEQKEFQEMLKALRFSLELKNLWTNDKFEDINPTAYFTKSLCKEHTPALTKNKTITKNHQEIWNALTYEPIEKIEIEDFESLCKSYEENVHSKKHSITKSFDNICDIDKAHNEGVYDSLKMPTIKDLFSVLLEPEEHKCNDCSTENMESQYVDNTDFVNEVKDNTRDSRIAIVNRNADVNVTEAITKSLVKTTFPISCTTNYRNKKTEFTENCDNQSQHSLNQNENKSLKNINENIKHNIEVEYKIDLSKKRLEYPSSFGKQSSKTKNNADSNFYEVEDLSKELLAAGLPTGFSSSKDMYYKQKQHNDTSVYTSEDQVSNSRYECKYNAQKTNRSANKINTPQNNKYYQSQPNKNSRKSSKINITNQEISNKEICNDFNHSHSAKDKTHGNKIHTFKHYSDEITMLYTPETVSTKTSSHIDKEHLYTDNSENINITYDVNKKSKKNIKVNTHKNVDINAIHEEEDGGYNTLSHSPQSYDKYISTSGLHNTNKANYSIYCNYDSEDGSDDITKDYIEWYTQLKIKVKQVEFAAYIQEMSKLT